jgi:hypothetical protein
MPNASPDAALFAALVETRPRKAQPDAVTEAQPDAVIAEAQPDDMAILVLRLADSIRHGSALLREAAAELSEGRGIARAAKLLAQAEAASLEQAACARGLLDALSHAGERRAA